MRRELLLALSVAVAACDNEHNLGVFQQEPDASAIGGMADQAGPTVDALPSTPDTRVLGPLGPVESWTGYLENYPLAIGSDQIRFSFAYDDSGQVAGTVIFGEGTPPPPATDPNVGYPPGFSRDDFGQVLSAPLVGFPYSIREGSYTSGRLRFVMDMVDLWADWCALQPAPTDGSPTCGPNGFTDGSRVDGTAEGRPCVQTVTTFDGKKLQFECGKFDLCLNPMICVCSPAGCTASSGSGGVSFDMFVVDNTASGSVREPSDTYNAHFTKDP